MLQSMGSCELDMAEQLNKTTINFITVRSDVGECDQRIALLLIKLIFVGMYLNYLFSC